VTVVNRREQAALLLALRDSERGWADVTNAVEEARSALAVLESLLAPDHPTLDNVAPDLAGRLELVEKEIESWADEGIHLVTVLDEQYPVQLLMVHQRPPFLTCRGFLDQRHADPGTARAGARQARLPAARGRVRYVPEFRT
jgi:DNA processing protein